MAWSAVSYYMFVYGYYTVGVHLGGAVAYPSVRVQDGAPVG